MFLASSFQQSGTNSKPVVLHSVRVGIHLYDLGCGVLVVVAGILHDVLEDTAVQRSDLERGVWKACYRVGCGK